MSLIIVLRNISNLASISDYEYTVLVNEKVLERGKVAGHKRSDGWQKLVKQFATRRTPDEN